jgi:hypothetical protein
MGRVSIVWVSVRPVYFNLPIGSRTLAVSRRLKRRRSEAEAGGGRPQCVDTY